jgi:hypothetical protein
MKKTSNNIVSVSPNRTPGSESSSADQSIGDYIKKVLAPAFYLQTPPRQLTRLHCHYSCKEEERTMRQQQEGEHRP